MKQNMKAADRVLRIVAGLAVWPALALGPAAPGAARVGH